MSMQAKNMRFDKFPAREYMSLKLIFGCSHRNIHNIFIRSIIQWPELNKNTYDYQCGCVAHQSNNNEQKKIELIVCRFAFVFV